MADSRELTFRQISELKKFKVGQQFEPMIYQDVADELVRMGMLDRTSTGYVLTVIGEAVAKR
jgi:hypothetical protein